MSVQARKTISVAHHPKPRRCTWGPLLSAVILASCISATIAAGPPAGPDEADVAQQIAQGFAMAAKLDEYTDEALPDDLRERAVQLAQETSELMIQVYRHGRFKEVEQLNEVVIAIRRRALGEEHPATLRALGNMAVTFERQWRPEEALALYGRVLEAQRRVAGEEDPDTLATRHNMATLLQRMDRLDEARAMFEQVLEARTRILGEEDLDTVSSLNNLAIVLELQGNVDEARRMYARVVEVQSRLLGEDDPQTLLSMANLGTVYHKLGRLEEARMMLEKVLAIQQRIRPADHPDMIGTMYNLAVILDAEGRSAESQAMFERVLDVLVRVHGEDHPDALHCMNGLALVLQGRGRLEEAQALHEHVLEVRRRVLGDGHGNTLSSLSNLANVFHARWRIEEAQELFQQVYDARLRIYGEEHSRTLEAMHNLAVMLRVRGRLAEAQAMHEREIEIARRVLGEEHHSFIVSKHNLAAVLYDRGLLNEAHAMQVQTVDAFRRLLGEDHQRVSLAQGDLGRTLALLGDLPAAHQLLVQAIARESARVHRDLPLLSAAERRRHRALLGDWSHWLAVISLAAPYLPASEALDAHLATAGLLFESARAERLALAGLHDSDPAIRELHHEARALRRQLVRASLSSEVEPAHAAELRERLADAERRLRVASPAYANEARLAGLGIADIAASLDDGQAMVAFTTCFPLMPAADDTGQPVSNLSDNRHYAAFILTRDVTANEGFKVRLVDLGPAAAIDAGVDRFRALITPGAPDFDPLDEDSAARRLVALRRLVWDPLGLGEMRRIYIWPDGRLNELPLEALCSGCDDGGIWRYLIETGPEMVYLAGGRELARLRLEHPPTPQNHAILIGAPDFDATTLQLADAREELASTDWPRGGHDIALDVPKAGSPLSTPESLPRLGGAPAVQIPSRWVNLGGVEAFIHHAAGQISTMMPETDLPRPLTGTLAVKEGLLRIHRPRILQIATHGWYTPPSEEERLLMRSEVGASGRSAKFLSDPMMRSLLVFAGANTRGEHLAPADQGLLTALEVSDVDLRGTEVVLLTACHTGQGDDEAGEAVAGLRSAFSLAGARSVVASLWEVPVETTLIQAEAFFGHWLGSGQPRYQAFRSAQLETLAYARDPANRAGQPLLSGHPFWWAAFVYSGDPTDLPGVMEER